MKKRSSRNREPKEGNNISPSQLKAARNELETLLSAYIENHKEQIKVAFKK